MVGYVRNDVTNQISDGNIISAAPLDGEFNAIEDAFESATGHNHDGSAANGSPITVVGPAQDVIISGSAVLPKTDNTLDLGSATFEFKDLWIDGTANIDSLVVDTADINAGTIDATTIGATTPAAATVTTLTATSGTVGGAAITTASNTQTLTNKTLTSPVITGGTIVGITDLAIADGGTGASSVSTALTNFGTFATRAAFVSAGALGLTDGQIVTAGGLEYRRLAAATMIADLAGWVPNGDAYFEHWNAVGDGSADDAAALQAALDAGFPLVKGRAGAIYKINTKIICPSNITIDLNGAKLRRGGTTQWMFETENAHTTWDAHDITLRNWNCDDDGTVATRGNFNLLIGDRIKVFGYKLVAAAPYTGVEGAWGMYVSGEDIELHDLDIDTEAAGLWSDAVHVGHVKRLLIGAHTIRAGDDGIALYAAPRTYPWCGRDLPSQDVTILPGFISSTLANGFRIGGQRYINATETASPATVVWNNVNIVGETLGQCDYAVWLDDQRVTADITGKNTDISIKVRAARQTDALRILMMTGNPDVANAANAAQHNFGRVSINVEGLQLSSGAGSQLIYGGGLDRLEYTGDLIADFPSASGTTHCQLFQIDDVVFRDVTGRSDTSASFFSLTYCRRVHVIDCDFAEDANSEFQTFAVILNAVQDTSFYMTGGRINTTDRTVNISGTGAMKDFQIVGTRLVGASSSLPNLSVPSSWTAGGTVIVEPAGGLSCTFAQLYGTGVPVVAGHKAYVTNGRKAAEGAGAGTGQTVYRDGTAWLRLRDDSVVTA